MDFSAIFEEAIARTGVSDIASRSDTILSMAERFIDKELRGASQSVTDITIATDQNGDYTLPADFNGVRYIYNGTVKMNNASDEVIKRHKNQYCYRIVGDKLKTAISSSNLDLSYYAKLPNLKTNVTNWLSNTDPEIYINVIMWQAMVFKGMREDDPQKLQVISAKSANLSDYIKSLIDSFIRNDTLNSYQSMRVNIGARE